MKTSFLIFVLLCVIASSCGQQITKFWQFDNEAHHGHYHHKHDPNHDHDHSNLHHSSHSHSHPVRIVKTEHEDTEHRTRITTHRKPNIFHEGNRPVAIVRAASNPIHVHEHHPYDSRTPHLHDADPHPGAIAAPPGYPSSDYVKYFAKYTSRGGAARDASHSYYRAHNGHLNNYNVEPEYSAPQPVKAAHVGARPYVVSDGYSSALVLPPPVDVPAPTASIGAGHNYHARIENGQVSSPTGNGPHYGFYYGNDPNGGKLVVGHRQLNF